jgi:hypothetical protein
MGGAGKGTQMTGEEKRAILAEIAQEIAQARGELDAASRAMLGTVQRVKGKLDWIGCIRTSLSRHRVKWISGAALAGYFFSRIPRRINTASRLVGRFATLWSFTKFFGGFAKPWLQDFAGAKFAEIIRRATHARNRPGDDESDRR